MWPVFINIVFAPRNGPEHGGSSLGRRPCAAALEFQVPTVPWLFSYLCLPAKLRSRWPRFLRVTDIGLRAALGAHGSRRLRGPQIEPLNGAAFSLAPLEPLTARPCKLRRAQWSKAEEHGAGIFRTAFTLGK